MQFGDVVLRITESVSFPLLSAYLIGILASVSPCPLATNITAMAYISRKITDRRYVVTSGILYTLGRTTSYFIIGALIILAGMKIPHVADTLQDAGEKYLGPLLLIVGIIMLDIVKLPVLQGGGRLGIGLLFAPQAGADTRRGVGRYAKKAQVQAARWSPTVQSGMKDAMDRSKSLIRKDEQRPQIEAA